MNYTNKMSILLCCKILKIPETLKARQITTQKSTLTAKGSACSQEIGAPHDAGLIFSGSDSGTATRMKQMSSMAIADAKTTTRLSPYARLR